MARATRGMGEYGKLTAAEQLIIEQRTAQLSDRLLGLSQRLAAINGDVGEEDSRGTGDVSAPTGSGHGASVSPPDR